MSAVKSKDTKPEIVVRKYLFAKGFRFRVNNRRLPGSPDIVLRKYKAVIFVDGCFWHGHEGCRLSRLPQTNTDYWRQKINMNMARDMRVDVELRLLGWRVIRVWECELSLPARPATLDYLCSLLTRGATAGKYMSDDNCALPSVAEPLVPYRKRNAVHKET